MSISPRPRAFTLIELLVVVAIIAILAAIALPNFLEAQTRAKVSRSKADLRTVVTGLESYRVDWNAYPTYHYANTAVPELSFHIGGRVDGFGVPDTAYNGACPLTTPISYLTTMPEDGFSAEDASIAPEVAQFHYVNWQYATEQIPSRPTFWWAYENYGAYRLHSRGPDLEGPDSGTPYDSTNGSVSRGDVIYGPRTGYDKLVMTTFAP